MLQLIIITMVKTKEIANIATSHFSKESKAFFLPPHFQFDKDIQEKRQWYMNIEGASTLVHEEAPPSVNSPQLLQSNL